MRLKRYEGVDMSEVTKTSKGIHLIVQEYIRATKLEGPFHSAHEGFAVILEELEELKDEVWKKASKRDLDLMKTEAVHVGAMALRFLVDLCLDESA